MDQVMIEPFHFDGDLPHLTTVRRTLPCGLDVIVHPDAGAPSAAVSVWYRVGSSDERPGRTGFAHLFEHLMFEASENHKGEYFAPF